MSKPGWSQGLTEASRTALGMALLGTLATLPPLGAAQAKASSGRQGGKSQVRAQAPAPVTQREVAAAFRAVETASLRIFALTSANRPTQPTPSDVPATRSQIVAQMHRIVQLCKPRFKFTPRAVPFDRAVITLPKGDPRTQVESLIKWGFVGRVAPLAAGKGEHLSPTEFGDALGLFISRLADLTHTPSSKWSPYMNQHRGDG